MKVILLEDETKENGIIRGVEAHVKSVGGEMIRVTRPNSALPYLGKGDISLVVIHHYSEPGKESFDDVDTLRAQFPNMKYAGYSGNLRIALEYAHIPKNPAMEFIKKFKEHYDFALFNISQLSLLLLK
jgi:hypothetical protein